MCIPVRQFGGKRDFSTYHPYYPTRQVHIQQCPGGDPGIGLLSADGHYWETGARTLWTGQDWAFFNL
jgi:hypothetical protein